MTKQNATNFGGDEPVSTTFLFEGDVNALDPKAQGNGGREFDSRHLQWARRLIGKPTVSKTVTGSSSLSVPDIDSPSKI